MNPSTFFIVPTQGKSVRDPQTGKPLPAAGAAKPKIAYWLRRVRDGDVIVKPAPKRVTVPAALATTAKKDDAK